MNSFQRHDSSPTRIALLVAFLTAFLLLITQRGGPFFSKPIQQAANDAVSPIAEILSYPVRSVEGVFARMQDRRRAFDDNILLRAEVAKLRDNQTRYDLLSLKVKRYEQILSVDSDEGAPLKKVAARAVSETRGPFVRSLLLNAGRKNDVEIGHPVLTADGMIGHVINAGKNSARVLRLEDLSSRIPVINQRSEGKAILSGDNTARPVLSFLQNVSDWQVGDSIVTSGDDGMLPAGLPIGTVIKQGGTELRVKLYAENKPVDWVWVSPYTPLSAPSEDEIDELGAGGEGIETPESQNSESQNSETQNSEAPNSESQNSETPNPETATSQTPNPPIGASAAPVTPAAPEMPAASPGETP